MDTKLKKFSRSKITKSIAFILAVVFFAAAVVNVAALISGAMQSSEKQSIIKSYLTNGDYLITRGSKFRDALERYCEAAVKTKLVYKNGSEEEYEAYKAARDNQTSLLLKDARESLVENILAESGKSDFNFLLNAVDSKKVTLKKLGGHTCYINSGTTLHQGGIGGAWESYITDKHGNVYHSDYYDYFCEVINDGNIGENEPYETTTIPAKDGEFVTTTVYDKKSPYDYIMYSRNPIPDSIKKKAQNPKNIVEICSLQHIDTMEKFDGYYEFTVDDSQLVDAGPQGFFRETVNNLSDFKGKAEFYKDEFSRFSHASIIIADEDSGKIIFSNATDFNTTSKTLSEAEKQVDWAAFGFTYSVNSGAAYGKMISGDSMIKDTVDYVCETLNRDFAGFGGNYKIFVMTDSFFSDGDLAAGISDSYDPFEGALADSKEAQKELRSQLIRAVLFLCLFLVLTVYLILVAGRKPEDNEIHPAYGDKIFTLLRTFIDLGAIAAIATGAVVWVGYSIENIAASGNVFYYSVIVLCGISAGAFLLDWLLFLARHIKNRSLFKNLFIVWLVRKVSAKIRESRKRLKALPESYGNILNDVLKKLALLVLLPNIVVGLPCVFGVSGGSFGGWFFGLLLALYDLAALGYAAYYAFCVRKVFSALEEMRKGNHTIRIETEKMPAAVRSAALDVMHLGEGLRAAVENAVKEERMKAELITNVSHDLKTPLTSIINYTDLLSRCEITDETALGYIGVLKEKSKRLKKLIEDLVEASKASSGAMKVELMKVSLSELALQLEGEYEDEYQAKGLELIVDSEEEEIFVLADGKLCHRVLDNLMGNIKKYALPNTRVYMTLKKSADGSFASVTLKNISEGKLNISPQELKARFVRGDASRTSEGNGLGLSIADNLCTLQGGKLDIEIIGDLFCATVTLKTAD